MYEIRSRILLALIPLFIGTACGDPTSVNVDPLIDEDAGTEDAGAGAKTPDADTGACGDGILDEGEVCDKAIDSCCNATCDGALAVNTECRVASGVCDKAEVCNGASFICPVDVVADSAVVCRADTGNGCDLAETCDGTTVDCPTDTFAASSVVCRASAGGCDVADTCTGADDTCPTDVVADSAVVCRADTGNGCDLAETCDGTTVDCPTDTFAASSVVCRASAGGCDVADTCTGADDTCPVDVVADSAVVCRADSGNGCDLAETCDGTTVDCPIDTFAASSVVCRASAGVCDVADTCTGADDTCPVDVVADSAAVCRADSGNGCDLAETCDGTTVDCPTDTFAASSVVCRASAGGCDVADTCTGADDTCPVDVVADSAAVCRADSGNGCDLAETCDGTTVDCPTDTFAASSVVCRASAGGCDIVDTCTGADDTCPVDVVADSAVVCRADSGNGCDLAETCDGTTVDCPTDTFAADTTACTDDGDNCTDDVCLTGTCDHPVAALVCGDGNICGIETCDDNMPPANFDGCNTSCLVEAGYSCPSEPSSCNITAVVQGDLVITEIMTDPTQTADADGQWFEIHNPGADDLELFGLEFSDLGTDSFIIDQPVLVPSGGYAVIGSNSDTPSNGGIAVDFEYPGTFTLEQVDDEIIISNLDILAEIDRVEYDNASFPSAAGEALSLDPSFRSDAIANDTGANWCSAVDALNASDFGTPGVQNSVCFPATCLDILIADPSAIDAVYPIDPDGAGLLPPMLAQCDMTTDGGGWTLVLNYVHLGGTNPAVDVRSDDLPLLGSSSLGTDEQATQFWGHAGNAVFNAIVGTNDAELRFYGRSSGHARVMDFTSDDQGCVDYFATGLGDCSGMAAGANTTVAAGHTSTLPGSAAHFFPDQGDIAMTEFPFWLASTVHWGIRGGGIRWEVDDYPDNELNSTIHQIWTRRGFVSNCPSGLTGSTCQIAPGGNWNLAYDLEIPEVTNYNTLADVLYSVDNTNYLASRGYSRVGYAFELDGTFVWTEMDDFAGGTITQIGIPVDTPYKNTVSNLSILTNSPNVTEVTNVATGTMEFWSDCYDVGLNGVYDYDDLANGSTDCFGSMQIHNGTQTAWAFNSWSTGGGLNLGIGNSPTGQPDWTFEINAPLFSSRRLLIYVQ